MSEFYISSPGTVGTDADLARYIDALKVQLRFAFSSIDTENFTEELKTRLDKLEQLENRLDAFTEKSEGENAKLTSLVSPYISLKASSSSISGLTASEIYGRQLVFTDRDNCWRSITYRMSEADGKSVCDTPVRINSVRYYADKETVPVGGQSRKGTVYSVKADVNFRFSANLSVSDILAPGEPVYLVGSVEEPVSGKNSLPNKGFVRLDETRWWTQELPVSDDGKVYKQIGFAQDNYNISFDAYLPVFRYMNGAAREWAGAADYTF